MQQLASPADELADELVSTEACQVLGIDRSTLSRWVKSGKLAPRRKLPGATGAYLFDRAQVEELAGRGRRS